MLSAISGTKNGQKRNRKNPVSVRTVCKYSGKFVMREPCGYDRNPLPLISPACNQEHAEISQAVQAEPLSNLPAFCFPVPGASLTTGSH